MSKLSKEHEKMLSEIEQKARETNARVDQLLEENRQQKLVVQQAEEKVVEKSQQVERTSALVSEYAEKIREARQSREITGEELEQLIEWKERAADALHEMQTAVTMLEKQKQVAREIEETLSAEMAAIDTELAKYNRLLNDLKQEKPQS